ncbi:hypothetical protein ITP53_20440 [Nonomuraea sp. K274]|uniref:Uncharacterized protein n=1 Tax=Nonomuraea cypriaca TaxID=1187855 RepID=A0A931EZ73_9ACTN|nr:hypothetical protein [Nonomuraea cypriaca]MBF8188060.1 hypothetical protein [Nonomuraea cypriaca]
MTTADAFWPEGARPAFSITVQFEAGGQPISGAPGPISEPILPGFPDLGQNSFYEYGAREGIPRLLDLAHRLHQPLDPPRRQHPGDPAGTRVPLPH